MGCHWVAPQMTCVEQVPAPSDPGSGATQLGGRE